MVNHHGETRSGGINLKRLSQGGTISTGIEACIVGFVNRLERPDRCNYTRFVYQPDTNGICADHASVDIRVRAGAELSIESCHNAVGRVTKRVDAGSILQLIQPDDVGIQAGESSDQLRALARELQGLVG